MNSKMIITFFVLGMTVLLSACGSSSEPTEAEIAALNEIFNHNYTVNDLKNITDEAMIERQDKFKAVKKVFITPDGDYGFISKPVAYNGPVTIALGIDKETGSTIGMRVVEHEETEHYVRDIHNNWFIDRFIGKSIDTYLKPVRLEANNDNEIITITGATVTTEGIVNGVNACMGVYQEYELGKEATPVPYMVKFEREEGEGPVETGSIAIRAYGVVLGEVTLEQIQEMPSVKRTMSIHSTSGTTKHSFRGTLLSNVISAVDPELLTEYEWVQPVGVDDYMSNIAMKEVLAENSVYVMYEDNGQLLETKTGEPGAMRIVVLDDVFGQRFTNYVIEIVLE
jgi:Na+-translocating ferredoxin:NAD+ oxidoreductase RnfG subunit